MTVAPHLAGRMAPLYEPFEYFVDAKAAADFPMTSRKHVRWRVRDAFLAHAGPNLAEKGVALSPVRTAGVHVKVPPAAA